MIKAFNLGFILILFSVLGFVSCSESDGPDPNVEWDINPLVIKVNVSDKSGKDLLNPDSANYIGNKGIKAIYQGKTYTVNSNLPNQNHTRYYMAFFKGLYIEKTYSGKYALCFGEFQGDEDREYSDLIVDWNDGTQKDTIRFKHSFGWKKHNPQQNTTVYYNGNKAELPLKIVK